MKKNVLLLFGGRSTEHEVSIMSAATMEAGLNKEKYNVYKVFISKDGLWRYFEGDISLLKDKKEEAKLIKEGPEAAVLPGSEHPCLMVEVKSEASAEIDAAPEANAQAESAALAEANAQTESAALAETNAPAEIGAQVKWLCYPLDIALPALHGKNGEDGTIQGLFELARLPYVGCGVLASASGMDKITTKRIIAETTSIRQADYAAAWSWELTEEGMPEVISRIESKLDYPVYVKPANAGSSVGVSKAHDRDELKKGLLLAAANDSRILIEENINGYEIECAVLGSTEDCKASGVGQIKAADDFYTYDAKYNNPESQTVLDPDLPKETVEEIRKDAVTIFRNLNGSGLSRVDFFVDKSTGEVIFNEINTMPGFTSISMYPMLWKHQGFTIEELMDRLIEIGLNR